jgi:putative transposase
MHGEVEQSRPLRVMPAHAALVPRIYVIRAETAVEPWIGVQYIQETGRVVRGRMSIESTTCIRTLRLKVKAEAYAWLNAAAVEVNQVWNYANEISFKAARPFAGPPRWLSRFDLDKLTAGATECFEHIGADTIQRVNAEFATRRRQFHRAKLRWRVSRGAKRSLGWIPFKAMQLKRKPKSLRFSGKAIRVFQPELLNGVMWKTGCSAQDAVGDWWLCLPVERPIEQREANRDAVGLDLGLKTTVATSDGDKLEAGNFYRSIEAQIAQAQRRGHRRQARRLHRTAARRRKDALHRFSRKIVARYQNIYVGDVSSTQLVKTRMAKSVLDAGWGMLRTQLLYKSQQAGRCVRIINEKNTTRTCSSCKALTGPAGLDMLDVRSWICVSCGVTHDRDVNAARNILFAGRYPPSVSGNEPSLFSAVAEPGLSNRYEARISALKAAA